MAKKAKEPAEKKEFSADEVQKKMEKYYKAQEGEKKGKALAGLIIGFSLLCFVVLLVVILKMNGVGKTIVYTTDDNGNTQTSIADTSDVEGTNLAEVIGNEIIDNAENK